MALGDPTAEQRGTRTHPDDIASDGSGIHYYRVGGLVLRSARPLVGIPESTRREPYVDLVWMQAPLIDSATPPLTPVPGGRVEVLEGERICGRLGGQLEFDFDRDRRSVRIWSPRHDSLDLTHDVVDCVIPLVLSTGPFLLLHGAALATAEGAVGLLGESGAGKSTFAAYWVSCGESFLSDDWFAVSVSDADLLVHPSHPSIRLRSLDLPFPDTAQTLPGRQISGSARHWMSFATDGPPYAEVALPLRRLVSFRRQEGTLVPKVRVASARDGLQILLSHAFLLTSGSPGSWQHFLDAAASVTARTPILEVTTPDGVAGLETLFEIVKEDVEQ